MAHNPDNTRLPTTAPADSAVEPPAVVPSARAPRGRTAIVIVLGVLLSAVLAMINGLQLASLERALNGLRMPDTRLAGYDAGYVQAIQAGMTDELYERYGASHYLWDMLFPLVFAATLVLLITRITRGRRIARLLMVVPVLYAAVDIAENLTLEAVFSSAVIDSGTVALASTLTVLKAVLFIASLVAALLALLVRPRGSDSSTGRPAS
ncbi:hypothetical protein [Arthrobacter sp. Br18]|uniref:hypothetical protein n=1 Tax=Arthrobacter sp. Br18 TaxID=1312954 RepID=UPI00138B0FB7|nr:hypothetical protein [Arthrobacter sp. Br18]